MNYEFCMQVSGQSDAGLSGRAPNPTNSRYALAVFKQLRAGCIVDSAIDSATAQHFLVGCIDYRINYSPGDVPLDKLNMVDETVHCSVYGDFRDSAIVQKILP